MSCILIVLLRKFERVYQIMKKRWMSCMVQGHQQAAHGVEAGNESVQ